jgi:hypothetical protein
MQLSALGDYRQASYRFRTLAGSWPNNSFKPKTNRCAIVFGLIQALGPMPKIPATRAVVIGAFAAYIAFVSIGAFLARPNGVSFPGLPFFAGFCLLPCLLSGLLVLASTHLRLGLRVVLLLLALLVFYLLCHFQLFGLVRFALAQSDPTVEGLISNFYVFSSLFLDRSTLLAGAFLLPFSVLWAKQRLRSGP